ncbi:hypothetical protein GDO86_004586, partial [Hymenochirus boettgeri]
MCCPSGLKTQFSASKMECFKSETASTEQNFDVSRSLQEKQDENNLHEQPSRLIPHPDTSSGLHGERTLLDLQEISPCKSSLLPIKLHVNCSDSHRGTVEHDHTRMVTLNSILHSSKDHDQALSFSQPVDSENEPCLNKISLNGSPKTGADVQHSLSALIPCTPLVSPSLIIAHPKVDRNAEDDVHNCSNKDCCSMKITDPTLEGNQSEVYKWIPNSQSSTLPLNPANVIGSPINGSSMCPSGSAPVTSTPFLLREQCKILGNSPTDESASYNNVCLTKDIMDRAYNDYSETYNKPKGDQTSLKTLPLFHSIHTYPENGLGLNASKEVSGSLFSEVTDGKGHGTEPLLPSSISNTSTARNFPNNDSMSDASNVSNLSYNSLGHPKDNITLSDASSIFCPYDDHCEDSSTDTKVVPLPEDSRQQCKLKSQSLVIPLATSVGLCDLMKKDITVVTELNTSLCKDVNDESCTDIATSSVTEGAISPSNTLNNQLHIFSLSQEKDIGDGGLCINTDIKDRIITNLEDAALPCKNPIHSLLNRPREPEFSVSCRSLHGTETTFPAIDTLVKGTSPIHTAPVFHDINISTLNVTTMRQSSEKVQGNMLPTLSCGSSNEGTSIQFFVNAHSLAKSIMETEVQEKSANSICDNNVSSKVHLKYSDSVNKEDAKFPEFVKQGLGGCLSTVSSCSFHGPERKDSEPLEKTDRIVLAKPAVEGTNHVTLVSDPSLRCVNSQDNGLMEWSSSGPLLNNKTYNLKKETEQICPEHLKNSVNMCDSVSYSTAARKDDRINQEEGTLSESRQAEQIVLNDHVESKSAFSPASWNGTVTRFQISDTSGEMVRSAHSGHVVDENINSVTAGEKSLKVSHDKGQMELSSSLCSGVNDKISGSINVNTSSLSVVGTLVSYQKQINHPEQNPKDMHDSILHNKDGQKDGDKNQEKCSDCGQQEQIVLNCPVDQKSVSLSSPHDTEAKCPESDTLEKISSPVINNSAMNNVTIEENLLEGKCNNPQGISDNIEKIEENESMELDNPVVCCDDPVNPNVEEQLQSPCHEIHLPSSSESAMIESYDVEAILPVEPECVSKSAPGLCKQLLQWRNRYSLCWLDCILSALVHSLTLKTIVGKTYSTENSIVGQLINQYKKICEQLAKNGEDKRGRSRGLRSIEKKMKEIQMATFEKVKPILRCELGVKETPVFAFPILLQQDPEMQTCFMHSGVWKFTCRLCRYEYQDKYQQTMATFTKILPEWRPLNAIHRSPCNKCQDSDQRRMLTIKKIHQIFMLHFVEGLPCNDLGAYAFKFEEHFYEVKTVIQYHNEHFSTWIANEDGSWLESDDLKGNYCRKHNNFNVPASEIHIVMWERNSSKSTKGKNTHSVGTGNKTLHSSDSVVKTLQPSRPATLNTPPKVSPVDVPPKASPVDVPPMASPVDVPPMASPVDVPPMASPVDVPPMASPVDVPPMAS